MKHPSLANLNMNDEGSIKQVIEQMASKMTNDGKQKKQIKKKMNEMLNKMKTTTEKLVEIIEIIKGKIVPETSIIWTRYNSVAELEITLEKLILGIRANDRETYSKLETLFGPTGSFQELSIDNGWGEEFIQLSISFDEQIAHAKKSSH